MLVAGVAVLQTVRAHVLADVVHRFFVLSKVSRRCTRVAAAALVALKRLLARVNPHMLGTVTCAFKGFCAAGPFALKRSLTGVRVHMLLKKFVADKGLAAIRPVALVRVLARVLVRVLVILVHEMHMLI